MKAREQIAKNGGHVGAELVQVNVYLPGANGASNQGIKVSNAEQTKEAQPSPPIGKDATKEKDIDKKKQDKEQEKKDKEQEKKNKEQEKKDKEQEKKDKEKEKKDKEKEEKKDKKKDNKKDEGAKEEPPNELLQKAPPLTLGRMQLPPGSYMGPSMSLEVFEHTIKKTKVRSELVKIAGINTLGEIRTIVPNSNWTAVRLSGEKFMATVSTVQFPPALQDMTEIPYGRIL